MPHICGLWVTKWSVVYRVPHNLTGSRKNQKYILHPGRTPCPRPFPQIIPVKVVKLRTFSFLLPTFTLAQVFYLSAPRPHLGVLHAGRKDESETWVQSALTWVSECMGAEESNGVAIGRNPHQDFHELWGNHITLLISSLLTLTCPNKSQETQDFKIFRNDTLLLMKDCSLSLAAIENSTTIPPLPLFKKKSSEMS